MLPSAVVNGAEAESEAMFSRPERAFQQLAGRQHERVVARRPDSCMDAGRPPSAAPQGSASAGQPSALKGNVSLIMRFRIASSDTGRRGATKCSVGVTSRSKPSQAAVISSR